jgi:methylglutaconyl-CoA hydratase
MAIVDDDTSQRNRSVMKYQTVELQHDGDFCRVWLNRPEVRNAFNETMIAELSDAFAMLDANPAVRGVVLGGRGPVFCAGGDVNWMKKMAALNLDQNREGAFAMAAMLNRLYTMTKPTIARVHGAAFAGGMGLLAACDIAIASVGTEFCVSEVRLGVIPATISPYVVAAIGERAAHRCFLTGSRFSAAEAHRVGLVHEFAPPEELDAVVDAIRGQLAQGAPGAHAATKDLIRYVGRRAIVADVVNETANRIAAAWLSDEGREGIRSFLDKRAPAWRKAAGA